MALPVTHIAIPLNPLGANIWDRPQPKSMGASLRRTVPIGTPLECYGVFTMSDGVPYAWIVPQVPGRQEWIRVSEAGGQDKHVEIIEISTPDMPLVKVLNLLLTVLNRLLEKL